MKYLYCKILFLLIVSPFYLYSQDIPVRKKQIVDSLLFDSFQKFLKIDISGNIETANQALRISREYDYSQGKARSYFYLARAFSYLGEYENSLEFLQLSEKEPYTAHNADLHSELFRIKGQIFMYLGLSSASIKEFRKGLAYVEQIQKQDIKKQLESLAYENLSISYKSIGMHDSMLYFLNKNEVLLADPNATNPSSFL